jgi:hypothetical protein
LPEQWAGYEMVVVDATTFSGKHAAGTDARAHVAMRLADLSLVSVEVTDMTGGETFKRFSFEPSQLVVADRGYSNLGGILSVVNQGADVLVRVNRGALPLLKEDGKVIDLLQIARTLGVNEVLDQDVRASGRIDGELHTAKGRLIVHRLSDENAEKGREWVKREQGNGATAESLEMAGYVVLFTTAPRHRLDAGRCLAAYRLRWQIELLFKRWKTLCHFDRLPNARGDTIESWIYAKVVLALLMDRLGGSAPEFPPPVRLADPPRVDRRRREHRTKERAESTPVAS